MRGLILAAGLGERLRPLTLKKAKPAIEFLNFPMLAFPYHWLNTLNLSDLVFNTHHLPETIRHAAMQVVDPRIGLHFTHEPAILGSGGGIWNARFHLNQDGDFAVANGDGVILSEDPDLLRKMHEFHGRRRALATLLVCPLEGVGTKIPGVWMNTDGIVAGFGKERRHPDTTCYHYASFMILSDRIWKFLPEGGSNILYDVLVPEMARGEKVYGFLSPTLRWFETGNAADFLSASKSCLELIRDRTDEGLGACALNLVEKYGPPFSGQSDWRKLRLIADSAEIAREANLSGFLVAGADTVIGPYATTENCVLLPGARVGEGEVRREEVV